MQQHSGRSRLAPKKVGEQKWEAKETAQRNTHTQKIFLISLAGRFVPGANPTLPNGQQGQDGTLSVQFLIAESGQLVPGTIAILSHKRVWLVPNAFQWNQAHHIYRHWVVLGQLLCINMQCRAMIWGGWAKRVVGGQHIRERTLQQAYWTPQKERLVCSVLDFSDREACQTRGGGSKPKKGVLRAVFLLPLFSPPPSNGVL